jgi:predicted enzyme related to lactoylglutathione lyase
MARVTGIGGVFFRAKNPKAVAEWYTRHFGFEAAGEEHGAQYAAFEWREAPPRQGRGMTVWAAFPERSTYLGRRSQACMVNYRVDDLNAMLRQLRRRKVRVDPKVQVSEFGKFGWAFDPEGHRIELWEPPAPKRRKARKGRRG